MLTHFGTLFAVCRNYDYLTQLLTLLNFHKNNVSRGTLAKWMQRNVSRGTNRWMPQTVSRGTLIVNNS